MSVVRPPETSFPIGKSLAVVALAGLGFGAIKIADVILPGEAVLRLSGGIAILVSMVLALVVIGRYILGPLDSAARHRRRPTQFTLADFLALMFLFQLPVALIRLMVQHDPPGMGLLYGFAWVASSLMWGLSVQTLSRAGIVTPWRRVVFLSAVLPIAYFGSVAFLGAALLGTVAIFFEGGAPGITGFWWFIAVGASLPAGFYWAARFVRTMVAGSQHDEMPAPP
jgi:hypothetical protein